MAFNMTGLSTCSHAGSFSDSAHANKRGLDSVFSLIKLNSFSFCLLLLLAGIVAVILNAVATRYLHLRDFPGPGWAAYTRLWLCKTLASGDSTRRFVEINQKYGSLARVGPNHLLTDDPEFAHKILAARSRYTRGPWFDAMKIDPQRTDVASEREPEKHSKLRRQVSPGFSGRDIEGLEDIIDQRLNDFVKKIEYRWLSDDGGTNIVDLARRVHFLAMDIITHICFGQPLGFLETDSDVLNFLATVKTELCIVQHFTVIVELNTLLRWLAGVPFLKNLIIPSAQDKSGIGIMMGICHRVMTERSQSDNKPKRDMLESFLNHGLSESEAETETSIAMVAGADTTATAARATLLAIISNPRVHARLVEEIDSAEMRGNMSSPIRDHEARKLPYLQACIKEGLRLFPPLAQLRERMVPPEGDTYKGKYIPGGTFIGLNTRGIELNPVFGEDAQVFRPERWLIDDKARLSEISRIQDHVFGHGTTRCLGSPIASMTLNKIFVELLRRFDISIVNPAKPWTSTCYGIFFQSDFDVRICRRRKTSVVARE